MQVLFTCGREPEYPRNAMLLRCFQQNFQVTPITDNAKTRVYRYLRLTAKLLKTTSNYDLMYVGFLAQPLMLLAHILTRNPIMFDAFVSVYDTLCFDRCRFRPSSPICRLAFWLDRMSCEWADIIITDTQAHARFFHRIFDVPFTKLRTIFVGCDENLFYPRRYINEDPLLVLFYGSFLPLHGIETIIKAAKLLQFKSKTHFRIIGSGPEYKRIRNLCKQLGVTNIEFLPAIPLTDLPQEIGKAAVCLGGHFSSIDKAKRVIAGKTFQCLAMGKPTIVGENPANHELLTHRYDAWFCPMDDPKALASAILRLINNPETRDYLGRNAQTTFITHASTEVLSQQVHQIVESLKSHR